MTDADRLLEAFIAARRAGSAPDPSAFLDEAPAAERDRLAGLMDDYFRYAPRRPFNAAAYADSPAARVVETLTTEPAAAPEGWPSLLPRLRNAAKVKRADLVSQLARTLGVADREEDVARYYNEMEHGRLPAQGVSNRVLAALAAIVGTTAETLRRAGDAGAGFAAGGSAGPYRSTVFAREAVPDLAQSPASPPPPAPAGAPPPAAPPAPAGAPPPAAPPEPAAGPHPAPGSPSPPAAEARDVVDELFRGGP